MTYSNIVKGFDESNFKQSMNPNYSLIMITEHSINYDEASGRLRLADFLYAEYSLEEVIYQLAKVRRLAMIYTFATSLQSTFVVYS